MNHRGSDLTEQVTELAATLAGRRTIVLTGAGCSTESGIPDYRGDGAVHRRPPVQYQEFVRNAAARRRYWARSTVGWPRFSASRPNHGHHALAAMEAAGVLAGIITQNVDGLHQAAGSRTVLELHGSLAAVRCLACDVTMTRHAWQHRLLAANTDWLDECADIRARAASAPDGDAALDQAAVAGFEVPACEDCGGIVKPDVVFFGENVPKVRVAEAWRMFDEGDVLLVAGSSLTVYSGRRFVDRARERGIPVAVVNVGPTRADECARVRVEGRLGEVLPRVAALLGAPAGGDSGNGAH